MPWVDRVGSWRDGRAPGGIGARELSEAGEGRGTVTVYLPEIGGLLPVYVFDRYEGFEVKTFADLTDAELEPTSRRTSQRCATLSRRSAASTRRSPTTCHGARDPRPGGTRHSRPRSTAARSSSRCARTRTASCPTRARAWRRRRASSSARDTRRRSCGRRCDDPDLPAKTRLGPPGVDTKLFAPPRRSTRSPTVRALAEEISRRAAASELGRGQRRRRRRRSSDWAAADWARASIFVGKMIGSKGLDLLLAAWPLVVRANPGARLLVVAFGEGRSVIESLLAALDAGDIDRGPRGRGRRDGHCGRRVGPAAHARVIPCAAAGRATPTRRAPPPGASRLAGRLEHERGRAGAPRRRRARLPEHLPGGLRHGRRRGGRLRRAAGVRRPLRRARGQPVARPGASSRGAPAALVPARRGRRRGDRRPAQPLAGARRAPPARRPGRR